MRVVSLISSATEMVAALGLEDRLVGRSHECDHPPSVLGLPALTRPRLDASAPSAEIDRQVRERAEKALSLYDVDREALRGLRPDVILTQAQCEVCAVSLKDVEAALGSDASFRPRVVPLGGADLAGVFSDLRRVAEALGAPERGRAVEAGLRRRLETLRSKTAPLVRPTVACIEWLDPLMASGNWVPELVEAAGGRPLFGEAGRHSPALDRETLTRADPDAIVLMPCGFGIERALSELGPLASDPAWTGLSAVRHGRLFVVDGNAYFNRPGPRLVDSAELLAELLHPGSFPSVFEGSGWRRVEPVPSGGRR